MTKVMSVSGVGLRYRSGFLKRHIHWAFRDISFELEAGESLGVIGANGSGKSSLLRVLGGIVAPDEGKVDDFDNSVSLLALQAGFLPHLSGRENAILGGMLLGLTEKDVRANIREIIDFTGLGDYFDQPIVTYSSGMRARLGFAVAHLADPDILLIDEVLGVGDEEFRIKSAAIMKELIRSQKTVVLVSHNARTLRNLCDSAIWIHEQQILEYGPVDPVMDAYLDFYNKRSTSALTKTV